MVPSLYTLNTGFTPEEGSSGYLVSLCGGTMEDYEITDVSGMIAVIDEGFASLPALYLGKYDGEMLKNMLAEGPLSATMVQTGTMSPGVMHNIHGVLPGKSDEIILISSHHDAPFRGYIEDGTGMGMVLSLAKYFSQVPESEREKTLVFFASAGHFYGSKGIETWLEEHADDYVKDTVLNINIEHVAARDFQENAEGEYEDSGLMQTRGMFISNNAHYREVIRKALSDNDLGRTLVVTITALGKEPPGEARFTNRLGIPIIHYISGPTYLLVDADTRDKVNPDELVPAAKTFIEIVEELSLLSGEELAAVEEEE